MKTVLVTGAAGFLGSWICEELLCLGHQVSGLDNFSGGFNENVPNGLREFFNQDICEAREINWIVERVKPDAIVHAAAYAAENLSAHIREFNYRNNVLGSMNLINAAINNGVEHFVFLSSIAVYGNQTPPFSEETEAKPMDPYGIAKYAVEMDLRCAQELFGLNYTIFRPHNVIGERQNFADPHRNVAAIFIRQCMEGNPMTVFGDGEQLRAFTHVSDVAPIIARSIERPEFLNETFNVGGDQDITVNELAEIVSRQFEATSPVVHLPPRHEAEYAFCLHNKLARFGYKPKVTIEEAIERMVKWARTQYLKPLKPFTQIEVRKNLPPSWENLK